MGQGTSAVSHGEIALLPQARNIRDSFGLLCRPGLWVLVMQASAREAIIKFIVSLQHLAAADSHRKVVHATPIVNYSI